MNTERLEQLIKESDWLLTHKNIHLGFISRAKENEDKRSEVRDLIEKVYSKCTLESIISFYKK